MIKIICVGKIKEKFYKDALEEYQKRLSRYTKLEIIEVPDASYQNPELNRHQEKESILKHIKERDYIITLEIDGNEYSSIGLANHLEKLELKNSNFVFIIGGSDGLDEEIKKKTNESISFSKLTFPHQLFRIFLLEQIYRSYKIRNHESYHK